MIEQKKIIGLSETLANKVDIHFTPTEPKRTALVASPQVTLWYVAYNTEIVYWYLNGQNGKVNFENSELTFVLPNTNKKSILVYYDIINNVFGLVESVEATLPDRPDLPNNNCLEVDRFEINAIGTTVTIPNDSDSIQATNVQVDTTNFNKNLATTDNTVQKIVDKVDDLNLGHVIQTNGTPLAAKDNLNFSSEFTTANSSTSTDVSVNSVASSKSSVNVSGFSKNLSSSDTNVQHALDTIDDMNTGHIIQDNGVSKTARGKLNFVGDFALTDDAGNDATIVKKGIIREGQIFDTLTTASHPIIAAETVTNIEKDAYINVLQYSINEGVAWQAFSTNISCAANSMLWIRVVSFTSGKTFGSYRITSKLT